MKTIINQLNKAFENRIRLGIMSALIVNDTLEFNAIKSLLSATDGNLASHLKALEKHGYVAVSKTFVGRKPNTKYTLTKSGKMAFQQHLNALEVLIKDSQ